jgi:D-arginine dehydrogenase
MTRSPDDRPYDIAIVGAGIVGASVACQLGASRRVVILEAEAAPGYHTTGRSAALFAPSYGPPAIRALTRASRAFLQSPPAGFAGAPLVSPRGALFPGDEAQRAEVLALHARLHAEGSPARLLDGDALRSFVPVLAPQAAVIGVLDEGALDMDVDALLQGCLRAARAAGARLATGFRLCEMSRAGGDVRGAGAADTGTGGRIGGDADADADAHADAGPHWRLRDERGQVVRAHVVVNAAGAWADVVAAMAGAAAAGLEPRRRSAFLFDPPAGLDVTRWPAVIAVDESWYLKPDAGLLLGSPANADPAAPHDVVPEELDIAIGIDRIQRATTLRIRRPRATWAGLRCFVADGEPVIGFDPVVPGFFWAAALGGYGIQSSPAVGRLAAAWLRGEPVPGDIDGEGFDPRLVAPGRTLA